MKQVNSKNIQQAKNLFAKAVALHESNRLALAKPIYQQVLKLIPKQPDAMHMLGVIAFQENDFENAVAWMNQAVQKQPNHSTLLFNLGNAQRAIGNLDEAEKMYQASLQLTDDAKNTEVLKNLGNIYKEKNDFYQAIAIYNTLLAKHPKHSHTEMNKALALLTIRNFHEGWLLYESRLDIQNTNQCPSLRSTLPSNWDGKPMDRELLVLPEQGLGDQIFYGSLLSDLEKNGTKATVCLDGRLIELFERSFRDLHFVQSTDSPLLSLSHKQFGAQIHLASLGKFFRKSNADFDTIKSPYLFADSNLVADIQVQLKRDRALVCGLSWDSKHTENGRTKRMPLTALLPALRIRDVQFVDLQYGNTQAEREGLASNHNIALTHFDDIDNFQDIDKLAALIQACDLVVTVSNSTAHLAAALGKPTLLMLPYHTPLWYWHIDTMVSPWYPSVTLLRQEKAGDWTPVVAKVATILNGLTQPA